MDVWVTFEDLHTAPGLSGTGYCHAGARRLAARYGIDWAKVVRRRGIWASELEATGDALALSLATHARTRRKHGAG